MEYQLFYRSFFSLSSFGSLRIRSKQRYRTPRGRCCIARDCPTSLMRVRKRIKIDRKLATSRGSESGVSDAESRLTTLSLLPRMLLGREASRQEFETGRHFCCNKKIECVRFLSPFLFDPPSFQHYKRRNSAIMQATTSSNEPNHSEVNGAIHATEEEECEFDGYEAVRRYRGRSTSSHPRRVARSEKGQRLMEFSNDVESLRLYTLEIYKAFSSAKEQADKLEQESNQATNNGGETSSNNEGEHRAADAVSV